MNSNFGRMDRSLALPHHGIRPPEVTPQYWKTRTTLQFYSPEAMTHQKSINRADVSILNNISRSTRAMTLSCVIDCDITGARIPNIMSNLKTRGPSTPLVILGSPSLTTASRFRCIHLSVTSERSCEMVRVRGHQYC